jgi:branched-chain amino acid transport system substrate-binding protein
MPFGQPVFRRAALTALLAGGVALLAGCGGGMSLGDLTSSTEPPPGAPPPDAPPPETTGAIGTGQVKVGLLLPLSAGGNAAAAALSMKNAAEMALAEFQSPNVQLLVKDDGGTAAGAQQAAQQAIAEGAEIILGPLFAHSVGAAGQVARPRGIPLIAFSTDSSVAARGVYLLSFLPESDVERVVDYTVSQGKRSFAALVPDNAYGSVAEAAFRQVAARKGARVVALERYPTDPAAMQQVVRTVAQAAGANGVTLRKVQLLGTGVWDDSRIFADTSLHGAWYAAPDSAGFRTFSNRYRSRFGQDPLRTATLAYDSVALVAALVKTQGADRFSEATLTNSSGFAGIDGLFRFRADGTNERGLAVLRVAPSAGQVVSPPPRSFGSGT